MNKTKQQETNTYIPYWKADALRVKKSYKDSKILLEKTIKRRSDGKTITILNRVLPTAKDIVFKYKEPTEVVLKSREERKKEKAEKYEKIPFSTFHNKLIDNLYSKENRLVKQQSEATAHEKKIENLKFKIQQNKLKRSQEHKKNASNVLVVSRFDSKGKPYTFSTNPSNQSLKALKQIGEALRDKLQDKIDDFDCIKIYKMENLRKDKPTYYIYKNAA